MNKKALLDDVFDLFFTAIVAIFLLIFLGMVLSGGIKESHKQSLENVAEFKRMEAGFNNLRTQMWEGYNLEKVNIPEQVAKSRILGGKTIVTCQDYLEESTCNSDPVKTLAWSNEYRCIWLAEQNTCSVTHVLVAAVTEES